MTAPAWAPVIANDEGSWNGWVEGPGNRNPWTEELGIGDAAYCVAFATRIPRHHGVAWPPDAQFGAEGIAYSPWYRQCAQRHGWWQDDHASRGAPASLIPGDGVTQDWNGDGVDDHTETVWQVYADGSYDVICANCGAAPGGVHIIRRGRQYLVGRWRTQGTVFGIDGPAPAPPPPGPVPPPPPPPPTQHAPDGNPYTMLGVDGDFGPQSTKALQWRLNAVVGANLAVDGAFGPLSKRALQTRLNQVAGPVAVDGVIGPQTVMALQRHVGAGVDGAWGPDTTRHLQASLNAATF